MSQPVHISERQVIKTVRFLCEQGESDHAGKGVTRDRVAKEFDATPKTIQKHMHHAEKHGKLESRPAVRPNQSGTMLAYTPAETDG